MAGPVVETAHGHVLGTTGADGVRVFLGIPYARPPTGSLRFRPPQPPRPWTGVRDAVEFSPIAPQLLPKRPLLPGEPTRWSEDCLNLNVWTPGLDDGRRPVLVWLHGGSFLSGSGAGLPYRGHHLARRGDVVVVTLNYRLGALGFLAHPDLLDDGSGAGNWGLLDQLAALQWVADHAEAFGGDPGNVTLFGESAGAMCVSTLLGARRPPKLFRRAIAQSGGPVTLSMETAAETAELLATEVGVEAGAVWRLRDVPVPDLLKAQARLGKRGVGEGLLLGPVVDGGLLDRPPLEAVAAGRSEGVSLLAGSNRDEMTYFVMGDPQLLALDDAGLLERLERTIGEDAGPAIEAYKALRAERGDSASPLALWCAIQTDWVFRMPMLRLLDAQARHVDQSYAYLFTWTSPMAGGLLGACHGLDVPFVFGSLIHPDIARFTGEGPAAEALADYVQEAWLAFARNGDPSLPALSWPPHDGERRPTMVLGPERLVEDDPLSGERQFWQTRG